MLERREKCACQHGQILIQASRGNREATLKVSARSLENQRPATNIVTESPGLEKSGQIRKL